MGLATTGSGVGQLVLSPLLELGLESLGLAPTLLLLGASILSCLLFVCLIRRAEAPEYLDVEVQQQQSRSLGMNSPEVGIYKRKQELDQESD